MSTLNIAQAIQPIALRRYGRSNTFKKIINETNMVKKQKLITNAKLHYENKIKNPGWFSDTKNQEAKLKNIKNLEKGYFPKSTVGGKTRKRRTVRRTRKH